MSDELVALFDLAFRWAGVAVFAFGGAYAFVSLLGWLTGKIFDSLGLTADMLRAARIMYRERRSAERKTSTTPTE